MKKLFLYAYDRINLGDDLFVHTIANRYPNVKFYLWSTAENKTTFSCLKNVVVLDPDSSRIRFLKKIRPSLASRYKNRKELSCNAVVYIGGSLFIEYDNWEQILTWWDYEALNRNFYVLGANFGPYHTEAYRDSISKTFSNMKDVCFRDRYSRSLFENVETVRYAPDILFSYPMKKKSSEEKQVFVSVIDCATKDEGDNKLLDYGNYYLNTMVSIINGFIFKGYKVVLSSFCKAEGDENAVERIRSETSTDVSIVNYNGNTVQEVLDRISESSFVIASRFHASILGLAAGKPVLPVIYSDKTVHVLEDVGFRGKCIDIRKQEEPVDIDSLLMNIDDQRLPGIDEIKKQSELHFLKLDQILKRK